MKPSDSMHGIGDTTRGLALAAVLAGITGMVDAIGFLRLGHIFVSYMSGNTTQFAIALGRGNTSEAGVIGGLVALFVLGAGIGQVVARASGRWHLSAVLALVTILLALAATMAAAPPMVLAMGALNAAMHRAGSLGVSLTYVTGMLVKLGQGLGDFVVWRIYRWDWLAQAAPWIGIVAGGAVAGALYFRIGASVLWVPTAAAGLLAFSSALVPEPDCGGVERSTTERVR
jgi:uncharacterized membrane protein YoaK (UPF0700 family)